MRNPTGFRYAVPYSYGSYRTECEANFALEDMFAAGEVSPGEHPFVERRGSRWHVCLWDAAA